MLPFLRGPQIAAAPVRDVALGTSTKVGSSAKVKCNGCKNPHVSERTKASMPGTQSACVNGHYQALWLKECKVVVI